MSKSKKQKSNGNAEKSSSVSKIEHESEQIKEAESQSEAIAKRLNTSVAQSDAQILSLCNFALPCTEIIESVEERKNITKNLLPPEYADTIIQMAYPKPKRRKHFIIFFVFILTALLLLFILTKERYRPPVASIVSKELALKNSRTTDFNLRILKEAQKEYSIGNVDKGKKILKEKIEFVLKNDTSNLGEIDDILKQYCEWLVKVKTDDSMAKVKDCCGNVIKLDHSNYIGIYYYVRASFPYDTVKKWVGENKISLKSEEIKKTLEEAKYCLDLIKEVKPSPVYNNNNNKQNFDYIEAITFTVIWACKGYNDDPGEDGYEERDEALKICNLYEKDSNFIKLRRDILKRVWSFKWFTWNETPILGEKVNYKELKNIIDSLSKKIEE